MPDPSAIAVGRRIKTTAHVDRHPDFILPPGLTGTIDEVTDEDVWVKLDEHRPELDEWENRLQWWNWKDFDTPHQQFLEQVEFID